MSVPMCIECGKYPQTFGPYCSPSCRGRAGAKASNAKKEALRGDSYERRRAKLVKGPPRKCFICGEKKPMSEFMASYPDLKLRKSCLECRGIRPDGTIDPEKARKGSPSTGDTWKPKPYAPWSGSCAGPFDSMTIHAGESVSRADICPLG